ncbi:adventurous gliding motility protein V [Bdellovibrio bacteriovorus]|uniref:Adventurous gliding motility protein V n=2 Tax=Pseudobdellovibrionaceae TaxID=213483 RepID=A0A150WC16_BDEBC|nr:adventurous gliding motility protein V [Bdellovibrio bacteriovorus]KYG64367.1 adventurous gliding motility protein V [Bdellovibrio bacteriovorus]
MGGSGDDKDLNFELNILPILDILSVLICFLLLTAVWIQIGTIDTRQAIGDNSVAGAKNPPSLWITVNTQGAVQLSLRDLPNAKTHEEQIQASGRSVNWAVLEQKLQALRAKWPDLKTGVVRPEAQASYGDVIRIMDKLKQNQFEGVGLSPLG